MPHNGAERQEDAQPIGELAQEKLGVAFDKLIPFGHQIAKIKLAYLNGLPRNPASRLVLVTGIHPTPAGEGKTVTTIGLNDGLNRLGKRAVACLREPAIGPLFGIKGGATGGGRAQVRPMEAINLHFTGDIHAISLANNLLSALVDNHLHQGNSLGLDLERIGWNRAIDLNDRALRKLQVGLNGSPNGPARTDRFDIAVASEVMAVFCLTNSWKELQARLGQMIVGYCEDSSPVRARDLKAEGAMTALLRDALAPNLVQTLERSPALIHGGPFANIAHGCNSVIATETGLKLTDYVVTEAGFGSDLGAEKFCNIKCRGKDIAPSAAVVVATVRALKMQGGTELDEVATEDIEALQRGCANLERHVRNMQSFGLPVVVAINRFGTDTEKELETVKAFCTQALNVRVSICTAFDEGSAGAVDLAKQVMEQAESEEAHFQLLYPDSLPLWEKIRSVAQNIYGASDITAEPETQRQIEALQANGYGDYPVCIAKTPFSFSQDPELKGAPSGHDLHIREVRLAPGAGFLTVICGKTMTMPGLPKHPASERIEVDDDGRIYGLF